jgi:hypothetical protein
MSLMNQEVRNVFGGVSEQPQSQRSSAHLEAQVNASVYQGRMLGRRPPTYHIAQLDDSVSGDAATIDIVRSSTEKYSAVIANGELKVYNKFTGTEIDVESPDGFSYLTTAPKGFRWVTVGDKTILVNRFTSTRRGTSISPENDERTLLVVRQGNFQTGYYVDLSHNSNATAYGTDLSVDWVPVGYVTPKSTTTDAEEAISTENIATELHAALEAEAAFTGVFTFELIGSTIAITPVNPDVPYYVRTRDGLGNEGLALLKGGVQTFEDLPAQAPEGFLLEVRGNDNSAFNNYWVTYDSSRSVWKETIQPGCLLNFDKSTMPHLLEYKGRFVEATRHDGETSDTVFSNADLALTPNSLLGRLCKNLTDGSQGTVLSNTTTTITTTALAGGGRNTFLDGDLVEVVGYGTYFLFRQSPWVNRNAGDTETNPYPSFIDKSIKDVFVTQGRLGFVADYSIVCSQTKDLFNLFQPSVTQVLPNAPFDITETLPSSSKFHAVVDWQKRIIVWTDLDQYEMLGEPVLTPETVSLKKVSSYANLARVRPISSGNRIFFIGTSNGLIRVMSLSLYGQEQEPAAHSLTEEVPSYIEGLPILMESDDTNGILLLLTTDGETDRLYAMSYVQQDGQLVQWAWGQWFLASPVAEQIP